MTDTYQNLLATVLACPEEDGPRLVLADWLEEQGDTERAEFIRVQCALALKPGRDCGYKPGRRQPPWCSDPSCCSCHLYVQVRELWRKLPTAKVFAPWAGGISTHPENSIFWIGHQDGPECFVKRGFVAEIRCRLTDWMGSDICEGCYNSEEHGPAGHGNWKRSECPCCHGTGTTPGIGPALVRQQPVEVVRASDVRPWNAGNHRWGWTNDCNDFPEVPWHIPGQVFKLLALDKGRLPQQGRRWYPTEQAAQAALSTALLRWAVRQSPAP